MRAHNQIEAIHFKKADDLADLIACSRLSRIRVRLLAARACAHMRAGLSHKAK